jgi:hypothetical protein
MKFFQECFSTETTFSTEASVRLFSISVEEVVSVGFSRSSRLSRLQSLLKLLLLPAAMMCLPGCATYWTVTEYGKATENFYFYSTRDLIHGDTNRLYAAGEKLVDSNLPFSSERKLMAHAVIDLKDGKIISREVIDGPFPAAAFEYPQIKLLTNDKQSKRNVDCFIESGQDIALILGNVYIKNPQNPDKPYIIRIEDDNKTYPRSTLSMITLPVVFVGAVAFDVVYYAVSIVLLPVKLITGAH